MNICTRFLSGIQASMHVDLEFGRELTAGGGGLRADSSEVIGGNGPAQRRMLRNEKGRSLNMELLQSSSIYLVCTCSRAHVHACLGTF